MNELEEKLGSILNDPNMMQQIMGMAKMLSSPQPAKKEPTEQPPASGASSFDPGLLQALSGIAQQSFVDSNQDSLLKALNPYLSSARIAKLERAMHAARMANAASAFLNAGGAKLLTVR